MRLLTKIYFISSRILLRIWRIVRIPLAVIFILFIALVIYRIPVVRERMKTEEVVKKIQAQKLTIADVMGKNLPPTPDPLLKDASIEGIDANENGIRDDVELAIFKLYPYSARIRAAELQYAMALQNELTPDIFNSDTLVATLFQESRSYFCIDKAIPNATDSVFNLTIKGIENLVLNTQSRKSRHEEILKKFMTSHANPSDQFCDIDFNTLSN